MTGPAVDPLQALADPTRRRIFELVNRRPSSVRELSDEMPVSQPAVSQHLRVLHHARLVRRTVRGRRHIYSVDPEGLDELREWVERMWDGALDAFAAHATVHGGDDRTEQRRS